MSEIRKLTAQLVRVETGPVQFGDDWPGVFIRGDHAAYYAMLLGQVIAGVSDPATLAMLEGLRSELAGAVIGPAREMFKPPAPSAPVFIPYMTWPATTNGCPACGIKFEGAMGYVCSRADCPTGLAGPRCAVECCAQDPIIGN